MTAAIKQRVRVGPGGTIQLQSDQLRAGDEVEVTVLADVKTAPREEADSSGKKPKRSLADYIGTAPPSFKTIEEVDAYIRELRDEWE
jgi:hypothetical protein